MGRRIQWTAAWIIVVSLLYVAWQLGAEERPHRPAPVTVVTTVVTPVKRG